MAQDNIIALTGRGEISDPLTELLRSGARQLLCQAARAELEGFMAGYSGQKTSRGHAAVVRSGHHPEREIQTGIGPVSIRVPKVRSKTGQPVTFRCRQIVGDVPAQCAALRAQEPVTGGGVALALPERHIQW